jgi:predicted ATPase
MITKLSLGNFRSIRDSDVPLGKITVLTGPNNSGKSSIMYGLLALKNIVLNPNQSMDGFLNLGFLNMGGFSQTVFWKKESSDISLGIEVLRNEVRSQYTAVLGKKKSSLMVRAFKPYDVSLDIDVSFPYPANKTANADVTGPFGRAQVVWNGISPNISVTPLARGEMLVVAKGVADVTVVDSADSGDSLDSLQESINLPIEELHGVDFIPLRRGFTKPSYASVPMQPQLLNEDELATLLSANRELEGKVAHYLEQMLDRVFQVRFIGGTANFNLQARDRATGLVCDLVNEGFGTNQLVTILTKCLREEVSTICIEESEIHLHPELMDKLVDVFVRIAQEEEKSFIISTHSEHIVLSLLNQVAQSRIKSEDVCIYYLSKEGRETKIERQDVNDKGQIKGGLKGFYETELKQVKEFFSVS